MPNINIEAIETADTELIVVRQIPIIEEALKTVSNDIEKKTGYAVSLECTEDTVKDIKKIRAELTGDFNELEAKRKAVKKAVMSPYEAFEKVYKQLVTDKYNSADNILKQRIKEVESGVKQTKEDEIRRWYAEYAQASKTEWLKYERAGINVTLSASEKSLKEQAQKFIDKVAGDVKAITLQYAGYKTDDVNEILVEYQKSLSISDAIQTVRDRREAIEAQRQKQNEAVTGTEREAVEKVEQLMPPAEIAPPVPDEPKPQEKIYTVKFAVKGTSMIFEAKGTLPELRSLKQLLTGVGGYELESIK